MEGGKPGVGSPTVVTYTFKLRSPRGRSLKGVVGGGGGGFKLKKVRGLFFIRLCLSDDVPDFSCFFYANKVLSPIADVKW